MPCRADVCLISRRFASADGWLIDEDVLLMKAASPRLVTILAATPGEKWS